MPIHFAMEIKCIQRHEYKQEGINNKILNYTFRHNIYINKYSRVGYMYDMHLKFKGQAI